MTSTTPRPALPRRAVALGALLAAALVAADGSTAFAADAAFGWHPGLGAALLARANEGRGAGTCSTVNPERNVLGGTAFGESCTGNGGEPEYWCADFAKWVWQHAGADVTGLDGWAHNFVDHAHANGSRVHTDRGYRPRLGDAAVYSVHHVGIVTAVSRDGSVEITNGDWGGEDIPGDLRTEEAHFARTSRVVTERVAAAQAPVNSFQTAQHYVVTAYVTPRGR
ncbi:CHAP domain-containing protein [Kitasatospora sp. RB6PN24]|uniref:CHAP domain-containing protein n=1 Tax=Kitasatospora humi TaxID=2893891 RepID=UPI001E49917C|nr:CHAP domain-containing protein [Kitasatospora humi]MCC9306283.1 CHAP domain-containing protein [Kitasatospora humi]